MTNDQIPSDKAARKDAIRKYRNAVAALRANERREKRLGITHETDTFLRLNKRVLDLEKLVPWHVRI